MTDEAQSKEPPFIMDGQLYGDPITEDTVYTYTYGEIQKTTITKVPEARTLTYTGNLGELVTAGTATGGTMWYALGTDNKTAPTEEWKTDIPTGANVGIYNVWYMARGDEDHKDSEPGCVAVTIAPNTYFFTEDTDANWTRGSKTSWHGTVDSETSESGTPDVDIFFGFKAVKVDGKILESTDHKATRDSIKLELLPSYLSTLNPGQHTVTVLFEDGAAEITFMIYAEDNPSGYYDAFEVTVISDEPVKPVPYRNGVSVSDHRKVDDLGNGKYRMYVDPELWNQYYFMVEPMAGYHIEYREAKGEIVDKGLHGGTIRVMKLSQTGDRRNIFAYAVFGLIALAGVLVLKRQ